LSVTASSLATAQDTRVANHRRANSAQIRQSGPEYGPNFQVKVLITFKAVISSLGSGKEGRRVHRKGLAPSQRLRCGVRQAVVLFNKLPSCHAVRLITLQKARSSTVLNLSVSSVGSLVPTSSCERMLFAGPGNESSTPLPCKTVTLITRLPRSKFTILGLYRRPMPKVLGGS
jgi:hypothetical protein